MKNAILTTLFVAATPSLVWAHLHISTAVVPDPVADDSDTRSKLAVTIYGDSATFTGTNNLLVRNGEPVVYNLASGPVTSGPFAGYITGPAPTLTSDLYNNTSPNPLDNADVLYELYNVVPVDGRADNVIGYSVPADPNDGVTYQDAFTNGTTPEARSLVYGVGNHYHGVSFYSLLPGTYDVTLRATDANGGFQDSDPVSLRVTAVPEPAGMLAVVAGAGLLLMRRRRPNAECI